MLYPLSYEGSPGHGRCRTGTTIVLEPCRMTRSRSGAAADARYPRGMARTVLVVDDDPVILRLLEVNFEMEGFAVVTAVDGMDGVEKARAEQPDIIVSDVMMPKLNGLELCVAIKADEATKAIPVVLLSAKAQATDIRAGLDAGADDYVTKPFEPLDMIDRVNKLLA